MAANKAIPNLKPSDWFLDHHPKLWIDLTFLAIGCATIVEATPTNTYLTVTDAVLSLRSNWLGPGNFRNGCKLI
jgi:hypothetical protein